ncbi:hypothetical protein ACI8AC_12550 [Geodermatophilus sp. SYSU D00758]
MPLYAPRSGLRARQAAADLGLLAWTAAWVLAARAAHRAVLVLAGPGDAVAELGGSVAGSMARAAEAAGDVPVVGDDLAAPLEGLGRAGASVSGAGTGVSDTVATLAAVLAGALVVLPVVVYLLRWLPWRLGWVRAAGAATRLAAADPAVLAVRAVATAPLDRLAALPPGTVAAWRAGDSAAERALAALELDRLGLALDPRRELPASR